MKKLYPCRVETSICMPSIHLQSVSYASMVVAACTNLGGIVRVPARRGALVGVSIRTVSMDRVVYELVWFVTILAIVTQSDGRNSVR